MAFDMLYIGFKNRDKPEVDCEGACPGFLGEKVTHPAKLPFQSKIFTFSISNRMVYESTSGSIQICRCWSFKCRGFQFPRSHD
uniref:Uncharacterized protein n=1 Tax=Schistosoma mansoni TaxID=6183 RepID=A0A3Q0KUU8_SCHMA